MRIGSIAIKILVILYILFIPGCRKDKNTTPSVTIHCEGLALVPLPAGDDAKIFVPNAFTPNGDALNDGISPLYINIKSATFKLYSEESKLIWESSLPNGGHPAFISPSNVRRYYYRIEGITNNNNPINKCGEIYGLKCYPKGMDKNNFFFEDQITPNGFTGVTNEQLSTCN